MEAGPAAVFVARKVPAATSLQPDELLVSPADDEHRAPSRNGRSHGHVDLHEKPRIPYEWRRLRSLLLESGVIHDRFLRYRLVTGPATADYPLASLAPLKSCEPPAPASRATESLVVPISCER